MTRSMNRWPASLRKGVRSVDIRFSAEIGPMLRGSGPQIKDFLWKGVMEGGQVRRYDSCEERPRRAPAHNIWGVASATNSTSSGRNARVVSQMGFLLTNFIWGPDPLFLCDDQLVRTSGFHRWATCCRATPLSPWRRGQGLTWRGPASMNTGAAALLRLTAIGASWTIHLGSWRTVPTFGTGAART